MYEVESAKFQTNSFIDFFLTSQYNPFYLAYNTLAFKSTK